MTDALTIAVALLALGVLGVVTWLSLPRPPTLDGERWFKAWLSTMLRGATEARGNDAEAWAAAVVRFVPYHPAGRLPERKITRPQDPPPHPALDGELALQQALTALPDADSRWARLYDLDEHGLATRLEDPGLLGDAYDPGRWLGPGASWDDIAKGADGPLIDALSRANDATWVFVGEAVQDDLPDLVSPLVKALGDRALRWSANSAQPLPAELGALHSEVTDRRDSALAGSALRLLAALQTLAPSYGDHVVLVGQGAGIHLILEALRTSAPLRDQVVAVLSLGGAIGGLDNAEGALTPEACTKWLDTCFHHHILDLEAAHRTPYFAVQWLDRSSPVPGVAALPLHRARFPDPPDRVDGRPVRQRSLDAIDLGPVPVDPELPVELVALALWGVVTAWVRAAQG